MHRKTSIVLVTLLAVFSLVLAGCGKAADLTKIKAQAFELLGTYGPPVSGLLGKVGELRARAQALPDSVPGKAVALAALEGQAGTITRLKGLLDGYGAKVEAAAKTGKQVEVEQAIAAFSTEMDQGVAAATTGLATVAKNVEAAEVEAKAAATTPGQGGADVAIALDGGAVLAGGATGVEKQLVDFLKDPRRAVDKTTWFNFDRLAFAEGKAELDAAGSKAQLDNVAAILKAFPAAKLKVGGYTDNVGVAKANQQVSQARAEAVQAALVAAGVDKGRIEAEGFGPAHPVCPANDTDACKAQNRRIALRVTAR